MSSVLAVTDETFEQEVLNSDVPVLVDFWAPWCGPCRMVGPVMDQVAKDYEEKVKVVKVNIDENTQTATTYAIRSIPTLLVIKNGEKVDQMVGAVPKTAVATTLEKHLQG